MATEHQREQRERRETLKNNQRVREQPNTFMAHTHDDLDLGGRFAKQIPQTVVGATAVPNYPQGPAWSADPVGIEPPLGYRVDDMVPLEPAVDSSASPAASGGPADAPSNNLGSSVECAGPLFRRR